MKFFSLLFLLILDVVSKLGVTLWMHPGREIPIFSNICGIRFSLNYVVNTGAAWGLFSERPHLLFFARILIIAALIHHLVSSKKNGRFALWLVVTGAIGNVIDYLLYGHVIDFFHFVFWGHSFAVFNLADSYITIAVLSMIFFRKKTMSLSAK